LIKALNGDRKQATRRSEQLANLKLLVTVI